MNQNFNTTYSKGIQMSIEIPNIKPTQVGKKADDYEKFVVVDTNGRLVGAGEVAYGIDLVKDQTLQNRADFLQLLFQAVDMEFKVRESRADKVAKSVSPADIMAELAKGK